VTTPNRRKRLEDLAQELRQAREELEELLAEEHASPASLFDSSRRLRDGFRNVIALDEIRRAEKRAEEASKPSTADLFAEALEDAFRRSRGTAADDNPDEN
jgi:hypothetical protein